VLPPIEYDSTVVSLRASGPATPVDAELDHALRGILRVAHHASAAATSMPLMP
jgi:hypothetical protein